MGDEQAEGDENHDEEEEEDQPHHDSQDLGRVLFRVAPEAMGYVQLQLFILSTVCRKLLSNLLYIVTGVGLITNQCLNPLLQ